MKDQTNILSELKTISPAVADLPKSSPFTVPENYFLDFAGGIVAQIKAQETVNEELSPLLASLKNDNPFSTPPGYLDQFKVNIDQKNTKVVRLFSLNTVLKYAVAASIVGIIATFVTLFNNKEQAGQLAKSFEVTKISSDAFAEYLTENESIEEEDSETAYTNSPSLLVQMDAKLVTEILTEIPENEISMYMDLIKNEDPNLMN